MADGRFSRWRASLEHLFPERHIYLRSGGVIHGYVLSTGKQTALASAAAVLVTWMALGSVAMLGGGFAPDAGEREALKTKQYYERLIADRQARLNSAVAQLNGGAGSVEALAENVVNRHEALTSLVGELGGDPAALRTLKVADGASPIERMRNVRLDQDRLLAAAEAAGKGRADRLRLAFRLAGLNPDTYVAAQGTALGGPLIEAKDPRALAVVLDVDEDFAQRIQRASNSLRDVGALSNAARHMPFAAPTAAAAESSSYGMRVDPFTHRPAFHPGLDFPGAVMSPVRATAPGVVSFTGVRSGYGNTVEVDHGSGFKTRYAHLRTISVKVGQRVAIGQRLGGMGSTGRSTGPHLHYEVWAGGRPRNPYRFLRAGEYVQQDAG
jgi:murein DD-endopeptidase MepM/ murein hydrolase activator NlpD